MKKLLIVGAVSLMLALTGCGVQNSNSNNSGPLGPGSQCGFGEKLEQEWDGTWECDDDDHKKKKSTKATTAPKPAAPKVAPKPAAPKPAPKPAAPKPAAPKPAPKSK